MMFGCLAIVLAVLSVENAILRLDFHDCVVSCWNWCDYNFGERAFVMADGESLPPHGWRLERTEGEGK